MRELVVHGRPVPTVFDLLGQRENDMTFALGWAFAASEALTASVFELLGYAAPQGELVIRLQEFAATGGFTDIEVIDPGTLHLIFEAKRGWQPPSDEQLATYERRLRVTDSPSGALVIFTQRGAESYMAHNVDKQPFDFPRHVLSWSELAITARRAVAGSRHAQRWIMEQLATYLEAVSDMRDVDSNRVYVVSIGGSNRDLGLDYVRVVEDHGKYFFPATGKNWPKYPPNYIAFRYGGRLQSIHHVDSYTVATDMSEQFRGMPRTDWSPHYVLSLGPAIRPHREVRTGLGIHRSARVWADIDLLLTSATITEAFHSSRERHAT